MPTTFDSGDELSALLSDISNHLGGSTEAPAAGAGPDRSVPAISPEDLEDMAVPTSAANLTYRAALETTAKIRQLSLLDFLR